MKFTSILLATLSGLLFWLGWPTYGFAGLLFIAFVPLLIAEKRLRNSSSKRTAGKVFLHAYLTFFIWNLATTYWIYYSTAFGMVFAILVNTLLMSLVFLGYHYLARKATQGASLTFLACLWISFERLHLDWDFSWPWLNLGNGFSETTAWIQWYEYTGAFGGSLWIWLVNIVVFVFVLRFRESGIASKRKFIIKPSLVVTALILVPIIISQAIVYEPLVVQKGGGTPVVIVQPNIDPYSEKYNMSNERTMDLLLGLVRSSLDQDTEFIITPETVLADNLRLNSFYQDEAILRLQEELMEYPNTYYIGGISLAEIFTDSTRITSQTNSVRNGQFFYNDFNSAMFLSGNVSPQLYHKSKLVVGVENFPFKSVLEPIFGDAMLDLGGTVATKTTQKERSVFTTATRTEVGPIICYESVYGEYVTDYVNNGADFLAIITNDAWWDNTQGHQQHLSLARLRAIENRRWIARSANTGISAIINHKGDVLQTLAYGEQGVIKGAVRRRTDVTFYTQHGDYIARVATIMGLFILLFSIFRRGKMKRK